jgi:hypothetical protein
MTYIDYGMIAATSGGATPMKSPGERRSDERIEGGYIDPEVSRELASMMQNCSFFARAEVNGWLDEVAEKGLYVETMDDVPDMLIKLLKTGSYETPTVATDDERARYSTQNETSKVNQDDSADPFDDSTPVESNTSDDTDTDNSTDSDTRTARRSTRDR